MDFKSFKSKLITETSYSEYYGANFVEFRDRYLHKDLEDLYGNFTNVYSTDIVKAPSPYQEHSDPMGVYGYPLSLILNQPSSIDYGKGMAFLRVLRAAPGKEAYTLSLQSVTRKEVKKALENGFSKNLGLFIKEHDLYFTNQVTSGKISIDKIIDDLYERFSLSQGNIYGHMIFAIIRYGLILLNSNHVTRDGGASKGSIQTNRALAMGYKAIEDTATNHTDAIIYHNEPKQIIFLRRDVFKIEEVVRLKVVGDSPIKQSKVVNPKLGERIRENPLKIAEADLVGAIKRVLSPIMKLNLDVGWYDSANWYIKNNAKGFYMIFKFDKGDLKPEAYTLTDNRNLQVYLISPDKISQAHPGIFRSNIFPKYSLIDISKKYWDFGDDYTFKEVISTIKNYINTTYND